MLAEGRYVHVCHGVQEVKEEAWRKIVDGDMTRDRLCSATATATAMLGKRQSSARDGAVAAGSAD